MDAPEPLRIAHQEFATARWTRSRRIALSHGRSRPMQSSPMCLGPPCSRSASRTGEPSPSPGRQPRSPTPCPSSPQQRAGRACPVRTPGRPSRIRVCSRERGRVPARANPTIPLRVGPFEVGARSAARRRPACRPRPGVPGRKSERARHSPVVARVAIPGRPRAGSLRGLGGRHRYPAARGSPDRGALGRARAAGRRSQTGTAHGLSGSARSGRSRPCQSRAHVPKRRCVEPQQRAGGKLSQPRVPLAGSRRPPKASTSLVVEEL